MKKVYAALFPDGKQAYYSSWPQCQSAIKGVGNVLFKGFPSKAEASSWIEKNTSAPPAPKSSNTVRIYVDGAYIPPCKKAGWGWVAVLQDTMLEEQFGATGQDALSRNIDGELEAARRAILWAQSLGRPYIIVHDYAGIAEWAKGNWKTKSEVAKRYVQSIKPHIGATFFEKVAGHSGDKWNDRADELAKKGVNSASK